MSKTNEGGADDEIIIEDLPQIEEGQEDNTDWKALAIKNQGMAKRAATKLAKFKDAKPPEDNGDKKPVSEEKKAGELDRMDKAVLRLEKITSEDEISLVQTIMKETGKDLESVLASKYFQAELKELRDLAATKEATPDGTKRSGQSASDTVDYWIAKGELPKDPALRTKVVNEKIKRAKSVSQFSDSPIV